MYPIQDNKDISTMSTKNRLNKLKLRCLGIVFWLLICGLIVSSAWFMTDVWEKFQSKFTTFRIYTETRTDIPTTGPSKNQNWQTSSKLT